jgi:hypothetical protein
MVLAEGGPGSGGASWTCGESGGWGGTPFDGGDDFIIVNKKLRRNWY